MHIIIVIGAVQAFFLAFLLTTKKKKMLADKVLLAWLIFAGIFLFSYYAELSGLDKEYPFIAFFAFSLGMLFGAITFIYTDVLTSQEQKFKWNYLLHGIPYIVFTLILYIKLQSNNNPIITEAIVEIEDTETPIMWAQTIINVFNGPVYMVISWVLLKKHQRNIHSEFSYTENIDLKWLKNIIRSVIVLLIVVVIMNITSNYNDLIPSRLGDNMIFLSITLLVFFLGYHGVRQQIIFSPEDLKIDNKKSKTSIEKAQYIKSSLKENESKELLKKLVELMEEDKPYLDGKLSLNQVAEKLNISSNHLSQVINENLNKNFFDFVNGYRVEAIKKRMLDSESKNITLLGLAFESGFNSKSSFNNIFKKVTGETPSQFMQSQS